MSKKLYLNREYYNKHCKIKFDYREPMFKERLEEIGLFILHCLIYPFYYGWKIIRKIIDLFYDHINTGNNGIYGPGYRSYYTTKFSWGKLSFFILIVFIILFLIFNK